MILLLTNPNDVHAKYVAGKLGQRGVDVLWFDHAQCPAHAQLSLAYSTTERME